MNNDMFLSKLVNMNYDEFFVFSSISKFWYVKGYMERNMTEVWEDYLSLVFELPLSQKDTLNYILDLNNLVTYLSEHREWGEIPCSQFGSRYCMIECDNEKCEGTSYIKHLALVYLEEQCEEVKDEQQL
jgi:hypothetical protein